jgi:TolB-like protein/Flp pilus assembly protein TadD
MFTDMVGFTASAQTNEAEALKLLRAQEKLVRPVLKSHGGRENKSTGDGFLVEFDSALRAVQCAIDIHQHLQRRNSKPDCTPIQLRIGVHLGDVEERGGDIFGDSVNLAARIEPMAEPGGICISEPVFGQVRNKIPNRIEKLKPQEMKNVRTPLDVYRIVLPWERAETGPHPATEVERSRIVVLPFLNLSPDPTDSYFADGVTEELTSAVSRVRELSVISRTCAMKYRDTPKSVKEIGSELGVGVALEGSVRKSGNTVRISAQLIDVGSDRHSWSQTFDRELKDIFAIQSEISLQVATALEVRLLTGGTRALLGKTTESSEAYTRYLRGLYFLNRATAEWLKKAVLEFEKSFGADPRYASAYAGLADAYLMIGRRGEAPLAVVYPKAVENALKAISLDPGLAEPHAALGSIRQEYEWKWAESEREFRQAIELKPSYSVARMWYALFLGHVGRFEEAIAQARRAQELDPVSPRVHTGAAEEYIFAREYDEAIEVSERALEVDPQYGPAHSYIAAAMVQQGKYDEAVGRFELAGKMFGAQAWRGRLGHALALAGRTDEARKVLEELTGQSSPPLSGSPFLSPAPYASLDAALVHLGLGDIESALRWLEKARDEHIPEVVHFKCEPIYDGVQAEPRFRSLIDSIGLGK